VNAAMCLVAAFFFLAGIYVLLIAHLIAFLQVLVYAGAIMVLFVFVIMLLSPAEETFARFKLRAMHVAAVCGALGVMSVVVAAVMRTGVLEMKEVPAEFGTVKAVGRLVYTQYLLPFEATSLLLLVAIVGAVVVAKRRI
jgi:NADH-quinone oxidoreductase subunit J